MNINSKPGLKTEKMEKQSTFGVNHDTVTELLRNVLANSISTQG